MPCRGSDVERAPATRPEARAKIRSTETRATETNTARIASRPGYRSTIQHSRRGRGARLPVQVDRSVDLHRPGRQPDDWKTLELVEWHLDDHTGTDRDDREVKHVVPIVIDPRRGRVEDDFSRRRQRERSIGSVGAAVERLRAPFDGGQQHEHGHTY